VIILPYGIMKNRPEEKNRDDYIKELCTCADEIATYLYAGTHWHMKAANYSRMNCIRGFGRLHDCQSKEDFCDLLKLEKIFIDKLGHIAQVNMETVTKAEAYTMPNADAFKAHFDVWINNESDFSECLNRAIHISRSVDMQIYKELACLAERVQNEIMRARMIKDSFSFGGWNPHDISVKSKWIHEYFEHHHEDGAGINVNLG
jgi:hypothetical protein